MSTRTPVSLGWKILAVRAVRIGLLSVVLVSWSAAGGCETAGQGAVSGAAVGALTGLAIGSLTGSAGTGAAVGAIAGGVGGAVIGDQNKRRSEGR
jgi:outer membrane lipoprotein SlyB